MNIAGDRKSQDASRGAGLWFSQFQLNRPVFPEFCQCNSSLADDSIAQQVPLVNYTDLCKRAELELECMVTPCKAS